MALRITYVGELGWELYVPSELAIYVYEELHRVSQEQGLSLQDGGYYAIDSLRTEKGYRAWGLDITSDTTPLEAGLGFAVAFDKKVPFLGAEALKSQKQNGVRKRLAVFTFDDAEAYPFGDEPIFRNGALVGHVTSANFGHSIGRAVCMGYVTNKNKDGITQVIDKGFLSGTEKERPQYQIEINGKLFSVKVSLQPAYDPKGLAFKG